jgi:hypothetical protein
MINEIEINIKNIENIDVKKEFYQKGYEFKKLKSQLNEIIQVFRQEILKQEDLKRFYGKLINHHENELEQNKIRLREEKKDNRSEKKQ